jgi:hypothetical protein
MAKQKPLNRFDDYRSKRYCPPLRLSLEAEEKAERNWARAITRDKESVQARNQVLNFLQRNRRKKVRITTRKKNNIGVVHSATGVDEGNKIRVLVGGSFTCHSVNDLVPLEVETETV